MGDKFLHSLQVNTKVELKKDRKVCESCVYEKKKERKADMKDERVSVRCTSKEKEMLNNRAEQLGLNLSSYVKKILFPKKGNYVEPIQLIIKIQDAVSVMQEKSSYVDCLQEEVDEIWDMVKKLL